MASSPSIAVSLSLRPPSYSLKDAQVPNLEISVTLHAEHAIVILTWGTIFNAKLALKRRNFELHDTACEPPRMISLETSKGPKRSGVQRRRGHPDEQYYLTLRPGHAVVLTHAFSVLRRRHSVMHGRLEDMVFPLPGHEYRLGIAADEVVGKWWWGTVDDVLNDETGPIKDLDRVRGERAIGIRADPVGFTVYE